MHNIISMKMVYILLILIAIMKAINKNMYRCNITNQIQQVNFCKSFFIDFIIS